MVDLDVVAHRVPDADSTILIDKVIKRKDILVSFLRLMLVMVMIVIVLAVVIVFMLVVMLASLCVNVFMLVFVETVRIMSAIVLAVVVVLVIVMVLAVFRVLVVLGLVHVDDTVNDIRVHAARNLSVFTGEILNVCGFVAEPSKVVSDEVEVLTARTPDDHDALFV